jgi:hypothetical protein
VSWTVLQTFSSGPVGSGPATVSATPGSNLASGSKLIAFVMLDMNFAATANPTAVKDASNNSFTLVANTTTGSTVVNFPPLVSVWVLDTPAGDVGTKPAITATMPASVNAGFITVHEVSGLVSGTSASVDGTPGTALQSTTATFSQPAYTSSAVNELLYSLAAEGGDNTAYTLSGYTADANNTGGNFTVQAQVYYKNSTGGAESGTWSGAAGNEIALAVLAFKVASAAAPTQVLVSAPYRPPPPPPPVPAQFITGQLPAAPATLAGITQPETMPYRVPVPVAPQLITAPPPTVTIQGTATLAGAGTVSTGATQGTGGSLGGAGALTVSATQEAAVAPAGAGVLSAAAVQGAGAALTGAGAVSAAPVTATNTGAAFLVFFP